MKKPRSEQLKQEKSIVSNEKRVSNIAGRYHAANYGYSAPSRSRKGNLYSQSFFKGAKSSVDARIYIAQNIAIELPEALNSTASRMVKSILGGVIHG